MKFQFSKTCKTLKAVKTQFRETVLFSQYIYFASSLTQLIFCYNEISRYQFHKLFLLYICYQINAMVYLENCLKNLVEIHKTKIKKKKNRQLKRQSLHCKHFIYLTSSFYFQKKLKCSKLIKYVFHILGEDQKLICYLMTTLCNNIIFCLMHIEIQIHFNSHRL